MEIVVSLAASMLFFSITVLGIVFTVVGISPNPVSHEPRQDKSGFDYTQYRFKVKLSKGMTYSRTSIFLFLGVLVFGLVSLTLATYNASLLPEELFLGVDIISWIVLVIGAVLLVKFLTDLQLDYREQKPKTH